MVTQTTAPSFVKGRRYRMSFEEFLERVAPRVHAEWVDGEVYVLMATDLRHGQILTFLFGLTLGFVERFDLGSVFVPATPVHLRSGGSWREPDLFVVLARHYDRFTRRGVQGAADLIYELISNDDPSRDLVEKFNDYLAAGVPEYIVVDAREGHEAFYFWRLVDARYERVEPDPLGRYHSQVLPGFWIDPNWLRQDPLPKVATALEQILVAGGAKSG